MSDSFYQYETLPLELVLVDDVGDPIPGVLDEAEQVVVSLDQPEVAHVDYTGDEVELEPEASTVIVRMPQEDTAKFERARIGRCCNTTAKVQVNLLYTDGTRLASEAGGLEVLDNLFKRVM